VRIVSAVTESELVRAREFRASLPQGDTHDLIACIERRNADVAARLAPLGCDITSVVRVDDAVHAMDVEMEGARGDLLILGAQGHGFLHRLRVGSTALRCVTRGRHPILLLRPQE
jgi:nucleotide-binding universal stress UspA family protein